MREIIFDTETTGLDPKEDRVIEIGAIELVNRFPTGKTFHHYIHPGDRPIHPDAQAVHGISLEALAGKPAFSGIAGDFVAFIEGAKLIAHNANFDIAFINAEFARLSLPAVEAGRVVDSLALARRKHPMGPNSLDALCKRYGIDNSRRTKHGALLDSELLAEVYIELIGGKQAALILETTTTIAVGVEVDDSHVVSGYVRPTPLAPRLTEEERSAHASMVAGLGQNAIWTKLAPSEAAE
ncbi:MAG: DNA polymerase III subunit epsilon [Rhizobiaceae bacterium]|jgi:DNA polymerase-3 subunit epsilon